MRGGGQGIVGEEQGIGNGAGGEEEEGGGGGGGGSGLGAKNRDITCCLCFMTMVIMHSALLPLSNI